MSREKVDEIMDLVSEFLYGKGLRDFLGVYAPRKPHQHYDHIEFYLAMGFDDRWELWMELIDILIDKGMDRSYPLVEFVEYKNWRDEI